jgi:hypothetical protein
MRKSASALRFYLTLAVLVSTNGALISAAAAACGDEAQVQCPAAFESIGAIVPSGDGFTVAGQLRGSPSRTVALLRLNRAGAVRGNVFSIPLPANFSSDGSAVSEPRKLIALPNGDVVLLAQIAVTEGASVRQIAWAARITPNDRVMWTRTFPDAGVSTIFHSGHYEANGDRLILVGRRTNGLDPSSRCEKWSQSWVMPLAAANGQPLVANLIAFGTQARSFTNRQAIYDITPADRVDNYVVTGFLTAKHGEFEGLCQDNIFVATLTQSGNRWTLSQVQSIGSSNANEVAFAIRPAGNGRYLLAGYGRDQATGAPAAQAYRVRLVPFAIEGFLSTPYPADGSDKTGGDRYRLIIPLAANAYFILAGSVSVSRDAPNQGMWQVVSADLRAQAPPNVVSSTGSDILDAVLTQDSKVPAVGKWVDEGRSIGWMGFIGDSTLSAGRTASARRCPDARLPRLSSLPNSSGAIELPPTALSAGAAYFERDLQANSQLDLSISVRASSRITISTCPEAGDLDLVVIDASNQPVAFSNFKKAATEYLAATLTPGNYLISIIAQTRVPAFELRIGPFASAEAKAMSKLERLSEQQRMQFADTLVGAGYNSPSNPAIALGGESVRAFLAIQESAQREIEPGDVRQFVAP